MLDSGTYLKLANDYEETFELGYCSHCLFPLLLISVCHMVLAEKLDTKMSSSS